MLIYLASFVNSKTNSWEIYLFNEFLFEKFSKDELFFFLYCRNLIFQGPQLEYPGSFTDLIPKALIDKLDQAIEKILIFNSEEEKKIFKKNLRRTVNENNEKDFKIDVYEVLMI